MEFVGFKSTQIFMREHFTVQIILAAGYAYHYIITRATKFG